ncbi:PucR family transcriptional regulator [Nocardia sp. NPDC101769]|uniref:PucR family transcriptional regulator n=1 Tax=Nocardia sp. NPDC101769 TaxID=3364333 RepID=UPI0037FE1DD1
MHVHHYGSLLEDDQEPPAGVSRILNAVSGRINLLAQRSAVTNVTTQQLPREVRDSELPTIGRRYFLLVLHRLLEGRTPDEDDLRELRERAAQRAREGVPLPLLLHLWQRGFQEFFSECRTIASGAESEALGWIGSVTLRLQEAFVAELLDAYQHEQAVLLAEQTGAAQLVGRLLLLGHDARADAERLDVILAEHYDVLALNFGFTPGELASEDNSRVVAGRRKLHRMLRVLSPGGGPSVLPLLDRSGGHVLLPSTAVTAADAPRERTAWLITAMQSAAGAPVTAAIVENVNVAVLHDAADEADKILHLVRALNRPPGIYRLADVSVAYQLSRPGPGVERLLESLAPVLSHPELLETLQIYLDCDLDRQRTARTLAVHPNTVNNRLNRLAEISPHSPFTVDGITALQAALIAQRLADTRQ